MHGSASGQQTANLVFRGVSRPVAMSGKDLFSVADAALALGFGVSRDTTTGVLTISGHGHQVLAGPGTAQVPVDSRIVEISRPAHAIGGVLYAPAEFLEKVLFPLAGATGTWEPVNRVWSLAPEAGAVPSGDPGAPLSIDVAVVHVDPTTQVVFRESGPAQFTPQLVGSGLQIRWTDRKVVAPFAERRFDDPLVAAVRFEGDGRTGVGVEDRASA